MREACAPTTSDYLKREQSSSLRFQLISKTVQMLLELVNQQNRGPSKLPNPKPLPQTIKISDIMASINNAPQSKTSPKHNKAKNSTCIADTENIDQIQVRSPFYTRCEGHAKCNCQFHSYNRKKLDHQNQWKKVLKQKNTKKYKIFKTQGNQRVKKNIISSNVKRLKSIPKLPKQNYDNVRFRVSCRNEKFEEFLKQHQLLILKKNSEASREEKLDTSQSKYACSEYLRELSMRVCDSDQELEGGGSGLLSNIQSTAIAYLKTLKRGGKFISQKEIEIIGMLVNDIVSKKNKILSQVQLLGFKDYLQVMGDHEIQKGSTPAYRIIRKFFDTISNYCVQLCIEGCPDQVNKNDQRASKLVGKKKQQSAATPLKQTVSQSPTIADINPNQSPPPKTQTQEALDEPPTHDQSADQPSRRTSSDSQSLSPDLSAQTLHENKKHVMVARPRKQKRLGMIGAHQQFPEFSKSIKKSTALQEAKIKQRKATKLSQDQLLQTMQSAGIHYKTRDMIDSQQQQQKQFKNNQHKRIQLHLNKKSQIIAEYERVRQHIDRTEQKLYELNLDVLIVNPGDSLIMKKKKIKHLQDLLTKVRPNMQHGQETYDELLKYMQINRQHYNTLMRNQSSADLQVHQESPSEGPLMLLKSKDYRSSLKFINLSENQKQAGQDRRMQNWIAIPHYVTKDCTRLRKNANQLRLFEQIELPLPLQEEGQPVSSGSLVQIQVNDICTVEEYESKMALNNQNHHQKISLSQQQENWLFQSKLDKFRDQMLGRCG